MHTELVPPPQEQLILHCELHEKIESAIEHLTPLQEIVIRLRYFEEKTFEEIGDLLGMCREGAQQAEARAIRALQRRSQPLRAFL